MWADSKAAVKGTEATCSSPTQNSEKGTLISNYQVISFDFLKDLNQVPAWYIR